MLRKEFVIFYFQNFLPYYNLDRRSLPMFYEFQKKEEKKHTFLQHLFYTYGNLGVGTHIYTYICCHHQNNAQRS